MEGNGVYRDIKDIKQNVIEIKDSLALAVKELTKAVDSNSVETKFLGVTIHNFGLKINDFMDFSKKSLPIGLVLLMFVAFLAAIFGKEWIEAYFGHPIYPRLP